MSVQNKLYLRPTYGNIAIRTVVVAKMARTSGNAVKFEHFKLEKWKCIVFISNYELTYYDSCYTQKLYTEILFSQKIIFKQITI